MRPRQRGDASSYPASSSSRLAPSITSEPYRLRVQDLVATGALGQLARRYCRTIMVRAGGKWPEGPADPRGRHGLAQVAADQTLRPFDPRAYFECRLYRDFSSGIPDQWMSHAIDMVHHVTGDPFPHSAVAHGGVFAWPDGRENPDTFQALLDYPKGSLVSDGQALATIRIASAHHGRQRDAGEYRRGRSQRWNWLRKGHAWKRPLRPPRAARPITLSAAERHGVSCVSEVADRRRREDLRSAAVHFGLQPEPHAKLAQCLRTNTGTAKRVGGARAWLNGGCNHGNPRPTRGKKALLECPN